MSRNRIFAGAASLLLGVVMFTGVAAAADDTGSNDSGGTKGNPTTTVLEAVLSESVSVETPATPGTEVRTGAPAAAVPAGSLPFTGGDVAGLVIIGGAALGVGTLMVRRSRTADNS